MIERLINFFRRSPATSQEGDPILDVKPLRVTKATVVATMRRLMANPDYQMLRSLWLAKRGIILDDGKRDRKLDQWAKLDGFDVAVTEAERWAAQETKEDVAMRQAKDLQEVLSGKEAVS